MLNINKSLNKKVNRYSRIDYPLDYIKISFNRIKAKLFYKDYKINLEDCVYYLNKCDSGDIRVANIFYNNRINDKRIKRNKRKRSYIRNKVYLWKK